MHLRPPSPASFKNFVADSETALIMAETATTLLASLTPDQRSDVLFNIDSEVRLKWDYRPGPNPI